MPEPSPAPALPPVPWWERIAAGVLAVAWVAYIISEEYHPRLWIGELASAVQRIEGAWFGIINRSGADLMMPFHSYDLLFGISYGCYLAHLTTLLLVIVSSLLLAIGRFTRRWPRGPWHLALGAGVAFVLMRSFYHRAVALQLQPTDEPNMSKLMLPLESDLAWYREWISWVFGPDQSPFARFSPMLLSQTLLALVVVSVGWWRRRRESEAPAEPK